jgi:hypothetical protein
MVAAPSFALPALYQLQQHPPLQPRKADNNRTQNEEAEFARFLSEFCSDEDDLLLFPSAGGGRPDANNNNHNQEEDPALDLAPLVAAHLAAGGHGAAAIMNGAAPAPCCGPRPAVPAAPASSAAAAAAAALASADDPLLLLHSAPSCGHEAARDANDLSGLFDAAAAEAAAATAAATAWAVAAAAAPPPPAPLPLMMVLPTAMMGPAPAAQAARDDDCDSVATLPMPHKKRRRGSSPGPAGSQDANNAPAGAAGGDGAVDSRPSASGRSPRRRFSAAAGHRASATAATPTPPPIPAPTPGAAVRAVLVAKVLTRSDATSKRIILPRVAIEANLAPQLASPSRPGASLVGTTFEFLARDATPSFNGQVPPAEPQAWPMVIKAWANGSNPKPVYVLEQVAPLLASRRLGVGDAVGILADRAGNFFVAVNTPEVRAAAARPTCAAFTFAQADAAEAAAAEAQAAAEAPAQEEAAAAEEVATTAAPAAPAAPAAAEPAEAAASAPVMMMVAGGDAPSASVGRALFLSLDEADVVQQPAAAAPSAAPAVEVVPPSAPGAAPTLHVAGQLVCARTTGCKRPAGHQGWCYCK